MASAAPRPREKVLAKVVLLTRDETDLIDDFLDYYGALFDPENVVVVDNGSSHPGVLRAYDAHRLRGGAVIVDRRPFSDAVSFMSEHMAAIAASGTCEFMLPIETDEFLFLLPTRHAPEASRGPPVSDADLDVAAIRAEVHAHLGSVPPEVGVLRYGAFWGSSVDPADAGYARGSYSRPAAQMTRFYDQGWDKLIVRCSGFTRMTQWCHHAEVRPGFVTGASRALGLLHFHDAGLKRAVERAAPVVQGYGYADVAHGTPSEQLRDTARLRGQPIVCGHKVEYLDRHLRRKATLRAFRRHLGRLPASPEEMLAFAEAPFAAKASGGGLHLDPDALVRRELAAGRLRRRVTSPGDAVQAQQAWDDLLFHEPRMEHAFEVRHVAAALKDMVMAPEESRGTSSEAPAAPPPYIPTTLDEVVDRVVDGRHREGRVDVLTVGLPAGRSAEILARLASASTSTVSLDAVVATSEERAGASSALLARLATANLANASGRALRIDLSKGDAADLRMLGRQYYDLVVVAAGGATHMRQLVRPVTGVHFVV